MRDSGVKSMPFTASPRYDGSVTPSRVSSPELRGLAYWPAIRPTFTTGTLAAYCRTTDICSSTRSLARMFSAVTPSNVSAQSPPWSRNASPRATAPTFSVRSSHSPANTSGGSLRSWLITCSSATGSGHSGCWSGLSPRSSSRLGTPGTTPSFNVANCIRQPYSRPPNRCAAVSLQRAEVGWYVDRVLPQNGERDGVQRAAVRRGQYDGSRDSRVVGLQPPRRDHAPPVPRRQPAEPVLRPRRGQVVADRRLVGEELRRHHRADGVAAQVLGAG